MSNARLLSSLRCTCRGYKTTAAKQATPLNLPALDSSTFAPSHSKVTVTTDAHSLKIHAPQFGLNEAIFPYLFLRDACTSPWSSIHPSTRQKTFRTQDIPPNIIPVDTVVQDRSPTEAQEGRGPHLKIKWAQKLKNHTSDPKIPDESIYDLDWLAAMSSRDGARNLIKADQADLILWDKSLIESRVLYINYQRLLESRPTQKAAIQNLLQTGICIFNQVPTEAKADEECELLKLCDVLGQIKPTWYGTVFNVIAKSNGAKNIAYTNLDLGLHMDLTHFPSPPRWQLLHFLHGVPSLTGGESYFADAYYAASKLRSLDRKAFTTLCTEKMTFEYRNDGHWTRCVRPTIELDEAGDIAAVNYSPPFQGALDLSTYSTNTTARVQELHRSLSLYSEILDSDDVRFTISLKEGDCVAFDNRRVLHARNAFKYDEMEAAGQPGRWLKGAYLEVGSVEDRFRVLCEEADTAMET